MRIAGKIKVKIKYNRFGLIFFLKQIHIKWDGGKFIVVETWGFEKELEKVG